MSGTSTAALHLTGTRSLFLSDEYNNQETEDYVNNIATKNIVIDLKYEATNIAMI